ncbi:MAG TPA: oxygenase MpaB family protein, partial [Hyphomonadaceae bacterium]|nr:oxygenase MpaB family protein [Hyphomonadaceae bacterium]
QAAREPPGMLTIEELRAKVASQREKLPALYGDVDFSIKPERFADEPVITGPDKSRNDHLRPEIMKNTALVERMRAYTMLGDTVADAYAALMPKYGFKKTVAMLVEACDRGVENVTDAPPELVNFIRAMEAQPAWVDMKLVEEGARLSREDSANYSPFVIRGAFIATFMNKYSALPMALTGTLSNETAGRRVKDTASFFITSVLPGALERYGPGFKSAAMVRLMHSMVRFNALKRSNVWDVKTFGVPIPQVDQMPAGLIGVFLLAFKIVGQGRFEYAPAERARVELSRYRCFLLGLPEELVPATPKEMVDIMLMYDQTLRKGYDDRTCGELLRATMAAYLPADEKLGSKVFDRLERSFSKIFFLLSFMNKDVKKARSIGVNIGAWDWTVFAVLSLFIGVRKGLYALAMRTPGLRGPTDRMLVRKLDRMLKSYGHAEFTSDHATYRPATLRQQAAE